MATITKYSTGADATRGNRTYTNPGNVGADDNAVASVSNARRANGDEYWLLPAFPEVAVSTIDSVLVEVQWRNTSAQTTARRFEFFAGTTAKTPVLSGTSDPTTLTTQSFSPTGITAAELQGTTNAILTRFNPDDNAATTEIDFVRVTVTYTPSADSTPPVPNITSASSLRMSRVAGKDVYNYSFTANEACSAWQLRLVPAANSPNTAGTLIESGASVASGATVSGSVTDDELVTAGGVSGDNIVKVFLQDTAGNWSI